MRIKKRFYIITAVLALLLLAGCKSNVTNNPNLANPFIGGTVGLSTYLVEGMPPSIINDAGTFPFGVGVVIENQGEADVGPGTANPFLLVRLEGINPEQFGATDNDIRKVIASPLPGAKRNFDGTIFPGEITTATFEPLNYRPDLRGNSQFTIRADVCYDYETIASTTICLKDDVLENLQDTSICSLSGEKFPQNSGGPLHISSVIENPMAKDKIQINFVIEHVGLGEFFGRPTGDSNSEICDFSVRNINKYYVDVIVDPLQDSGMTVSCSRFGGSNQGRVKLFQGAPTTISCTIQRTRASAQRIWQEPLNIKLKYRYGQFIETPIIIQDVSN